MWVKYCDVTCTGEGTASWRRSQGELSDGRSKTGATEFYCPFVTHQPNTSDLNNLWKD